MSKVHPDKTAFRAVDACGGTYTSAQHATKHAQGHMDALEEACKAVAKSDVLMGEMLDQIIWAENEACRGLAEGDTREALLDIKYRLRDAINKAEVQS